MNRSKSPSNKNKSLLKKLSYGFQGLRFVWRNELSFRIQVGCALVLLIFCVFIRPSALWCAAFTLAVMLVLALEIVNTAIESLLDKLHPGHDPSIGFIKDSLAGAVLVASIGSVIIFLAFLIQL